MPERFSMEQVRADQVVKGDVVWDREWDGVRQVLCVHRKPGTMTLVFHVDECEPLSLVEGEMVLRVCADPVSQRPRSSDLLLGAVGLTRSLKLDAQGDSPGRRNPREHSGGAL